MTATVGIDPRIRERRIAVQRDVGHRRLRRLQALGAVVIGLALAFAITRSPVMDVDRVAVETVGPADALDVDRVRQAAGVAPGTALASVHPAAVARSVALLPEVAEVQVRRDWPGAVRIEVTPRTPALAVADRDGGWFLVDAEGFVVRAVEEIPEGILPLAGVTADALPGVPLPAKETAAASVAAALPENLRWRVATVGRASAEVHVGLADGGIIAFAPEGDHRAAAAAAAAVAETVPPGCVDRIDVVVAGAPVLRRVDGC